MIKETKRKGFNFYRSYYDVFNELSDKDKLVFIQSLLDKQFLDVEPENLSGMVKFAWISQYNSIDQQVKGYKSKTKDPMQGGCQGGVLRGNLTPCLQEKDKEKEKVEYTNTSAKAEVINFDKLIIFINKTLNRNFKTINNSTKAKFKARIKDGYTNEDIANAIRNSAKDKYHIETNYKYLTPEYFSRSKTLDLHSQKEIKTNLSISEQIKHIKNNPVNNT